MVFWKRTPEPKTNEVSTQLLKTVAAQLPGADETTVQIVAAISGLLGCVAYSDRELHEAERAHLLEVLGRVHEMNADGARAIAALLEKHLAELTMVNPQAYTRALRELTDRGTRLEVLDVLLDLGAADGELSFEETQALRRFTSALGLEQSDYNEAQSRHRERLSSQ